jgi:hypothetical protein
VDEKLEEAKKILKSYPDYKGVLVRFVDDKFDATLPLTGTEEDERMESIFAATSALMIGRGSKVEFRRVWRDIKEVI